MHKHAHAHTYAHNVIFSPSSPSFFFIASIFNLQQLLFPLTSMSNPSEDPVVYTFKLYPETYITTLPLSSLWPGPTSLTWITATASYEGPLLPFLLSPFCTLFST